MPDGERQPARRPPAATATAAAPDALVGCPACGKPQPARSLEAHLRSAHRLYTFRGTRRTYNETIAALLDALAIHAPDPEAWLTLKGIADVEQRERGAFFLSTLLGQRLSRVEAGARAGVVDALARLLVAHNISVVLTAMLASDAESAARHLALSLMEHWNGTLEPSLLQPLRGLVLDRRLPLDAQVGAMMTLLRSVGPESLLAKEFLQKFVGGVGKAKSIERLRQLEERAGKSAAIESLCGDLEEKLRMTCPRCGQQLRKPEMEQHLWDEHRLVLDGRRVREPWGLIEEWAKGLNGRRDADVMERCRALAARMDPDEGPARLQRVYLRTGLGDEETRRALLDEARELGESLCPACYALVPVPKEATPVELERGPRRLYARGFCVELTEKGWQTGLEVHTPERVLYRGPEPGRRWTVNGARVRLVGACVLLALLCACLLPSSHHLPIALAAAYLIAALVTEFIVRQVWTRPGPADDRLFDYTWRYLVPTLHEGGYRVEDSAFAAALVKATPAGRSSVTRAPLLQELVQRTETAVREGRGPAEHLAALRRLLIGDAAAGGADPVPLVLGQLARSFEGGLSLAYAEQLLSGWQAEWWTPGNLARLRVLLCDRAFAAGFEVSNLLESGKTSPALGAVLETNQPMRLAALRYLWSLRASRPWDKFGETETVFEIAARPDGADLLAEFPDLLLMQSAPWRLTVDARGKAAPTRILLRHSGVMLQEVMYTSPPNLIELTERKDGNYLVLGKGLFRSADDLDPLMKRMERWFQYWFSEFLPQVPEARNWKAPDRAAVLRAWGAVACPECQCVLMAKRGEVGVAV
jgi:hypothetical protein